MAKAQRYDVIVVGAAAIGSACALSIAQLRPDWRIAVIERGAMLEAELGVNQRVWALGGVALEVLEQLGVLSQLPEQAAFPYQQMVVWDENSAGEMCFSAADMEAAHLGCMVDADYCSAQLQAQLLRQSNVDVVFDCQLERIDELEHGIRLFAGEKVFTGELVVAADGGQSWVRRQMKIFAPTQQYGQSGLVARIRTRREHRSTAWQRFLNGGPLAVLPLHDNQSSIVWSAHSGLADELLALDEEDFARAIGVALQQRLGSVELLSKVFAFPLQSRQAEQYYKRRVVLIGDAAHSIHPLAGQGANLGFRDVKTLLECLRDATDPAAEHLLARYQRQRRPDNLQTDFLMSSLHHAYRFNALLWPAVRGAGMNVVHNVQPLKDWLARQAMGI